MSTDDLIPLICRGDIQALGQFIENHRLELLGLICHLSRPELQQVVPPEDLLQEIAASAIVALPRLASPQLEPLAWLRQLARRRIVDAHRFHFEAERRAVHRQRSLGSGQDSQLGWEALIAASLTSPSEAFSRNVRLSRLQQAISGLGDDAQQAIRMRYVDGLTSQQIADQMDKSDAAIRVLLSRSLRKLQDLLRTPQ
jgi:RNA polymerase sigma-70 factor (ECF subfamily)